MDRTLELEIKVAYLEKQLAELDDVVRELYGAVERLTAEVAELRASGSPMPERNPSLENEKPPHY